jgi:ubiquinone/menaquinone biosynthesis C-methylase UbiE
VDVAIVSNILFQISDKEKFVKEVKRILKARGRVLLVDWSETSVMGAKTIFPKSKARALFEKEGFMVTQEINALSHHYGMILIKK